MQYIVEQGALREPASCCVNTLIQLPERVLVKGVQANMFLTLTTALQSVSKFRPRLHALPGRRHVRMISCDRSDFRHRQFGFGVRGHVRALVPTRHVASGRSGNVLPHSKTWPVLIANRSNRWGTVSNPVRTASRAGKTLSGVAGTAANSSETSSGIRETLSGVVGTASSIGGTPSRVAGTLSNITGTPPNPAETPSNISGTFPNSSGTSSGPPGMGKCPKLADFNGKFSQTGLFLIRHRVVEFQDVALLALQFGFLELDGGARVLVQHAGEQIRQVVAPKQFGAHRLDVVLHAVEHRAQLIFWIVQEGEEQLHRAIARAAAEAGDGGVEKIRALDDAFDGVGEGELHVVVHVNAHFLAGRFAVAEIFFHQRMDALAVKRAETVHDVNRLGLGFREHFQTLVQFAVGNGRGGHEVHGGFVALVVRVLDHVQRGGNLVDVGRHADHVQDGIFLRQNVLV